MIVDSSAIIAIIKNEPKSSVFLDRILAETSSISAANWLECALVADRIDDSSADRLDVLFLESRVVTQPVTAAQARRAREAHRRFGRGSGSKARLNFGDCFAYALAMETGEPLLFQGDDFTHTDVASALSS